METGRTVIVVILLAGLAGCAHAPLFTYDMADARALQSARTMALAPGAPTLVLAEGYWEVPEPRLAERTRELLQTLGLSPSSAAQADLWVTVHLLTKRKGREGQGAREGGRSGGGRHGGGPRSHGESGGGAKPAAHPGGGGLSPEVKLVLELNDRSGRRVWAGSLEATLLHMPFTPEGHGELDALLVKLVEPLQREPRGH